MDSKHKLISNLIIAFFSLLVVLLTLFFVERKANQPTSIPSQYPDFDAIKGGSADPKIKVIKITSDCLPVGCINDKPATFDLDGLNKKYKVKGKTSRAYLYIEALVDYTRPLTVWDDIIFKINGLGGHLLANENTLPVPPGKTSQYLYDLRSISYYPTIKDKERKMNLHRNINLFVLLQDGMILDVLSSLSSDRPGRVLREVSLYYECFEGSPCLIEEIK